MVTLDLGAQGISKRGNFMTMTTLHVLGDYEVSSHKVEWARPMEERYHTCQAKEHDVFAKERLF
jgi:hypothetical protein